LLDLQKKFHLLKVELQDDFFPFRILHKIRNYDSIKIAGNKKRQL
jgi:hypothetical protein